LVVLSDLSDSLSLSIIDSSSTTAVAFVLGLAIGLVTFLIVAATLMVEVSI
jgi:hypothetical protein